jgi:hypothetical protein
MICSFVILPAPLHSCRYFVFAWALLGCGFGGKKLLANAVPFLLLVVAVILLSPTLCFNVGILALPPSDAGHQEKPPAIMGGNS